MSDPDEITHLRAQVEQLTAENTVLREDGFRGSKAEALMALEYDRIPSLMKTPKSIAFQRKAATAVLIIVPIILLAVVIGGTIDAYWDHQHSAQMKADMEKIDQAFTSDQASHSHQ